MLGNPFPADGGKRLLAIISADQKVEQGDADTKASLFLSFRCTPNL